MGGSWKEVMEVLVEGIVVQVVGSVVVLLLCDSIAKWRYRHARAHPLLPLSLSSGGVEADDQPLSNANAADVDMETFNAAPEVVAEAVITIPSPTNTAGALPSPNLPEDLTTATPGPHGSDGCSGK